MYYITATIVDKITIGGVLAIAFAVVGWLLMHLRNHPNKKDITKQFDSLRGKEGMQWKDVCDERTKRIEQSIQNVDNRVECGFKDLKNLIRNKSNQR